MNDSEKQPVSISNENTETVKMTTLDYWENAYPWAVIGFLGAMFYLLVTYWL